MIKRHTGCSTLWLRSALVIIKQSSEKKKEIGTKNYCSNFKIEDYNKFDLNIVNTTHKESSNSSVNEINH